MNTNTIQLTPILGNDSLSNSRIVINDNFKILANALQNYQEYFDENGVYSSTIIAKDGIIELKANENLSIMTVSENGVEVNGGITTDDESVFTDIKVKNIRPNNINPITIIGNVKIDGNLEVTGTAPGGGDSTVVTAIDLDHFNDYAVNRGYIAAYEKGSYVFQIASNEILGDALEQCTRLNTRDLLQYVNKPISVFGKGIKIKFTRQSLLNKLVTNGEAYGNYIVCPGTGGNIGIFDANYIEAKISPLLIGNEYFIKVIFTKTIQ